MKIGIIRGARGTATNKLNELIEENFTPNGAHREGHHSEVIIREYEGVVNE